jgi:hypothetical protein
LKPQAPWTTGSPIRAAPPVTRHRPDAWLTLQLHGLSTTRVVHR